MGDLTLSLGALGFSCLKSVQVKEEEGKGVAFNLDYKVSLEEAPLRSILAREKKVGSMIHIHIRSHIWSDFVVFLSKLGKIFILGFLNPKRLTYVSFCLFRESFSVKNGKT